MKLRIGQDVNATDGPFGELGDIVIDPGRRTVTHLVVEPHNRHYQARLVPVGLVSERDGALTVNLDVDHLRQLEQVAFSDFVAYGEQIDLGDEWDVGTEDVVSAPYLGYEFDMDWIDDRIGITYDRIPKGECEIRRTSDVVTSDDHTVGHVDGLIADDDHLTALVVRVGLFGLRHDVLVPLGAVAGVRNDRVDLSLDREQFDLLPHTDALADPDDADSLVNRLRKRAVTVTARAGRRQRTLIRDVRNRIHPSDG